MNEQVEVFQEIFLTKILIKISYRNELLIEHFDMFLQKTLTLEFTENGKQQLIT
jgi:hypothetical protein